jgi:hypothetical protein
MRCPPAEKAQTTTYASQFFDGAAEQRRSHENIRDNTWPTDGRIGLVMYSLTISVAGKETLAPVPKHVFATCTAASPPSKTPICNLLAVGLTSRYDAG